MLSGSSAGVGGIVRSQVGTDLGRPGQVGAQRLVAGILQLAQLFADVDQRLAHTLGRGVGLCQSGRQAIACLEFIVTQRCQLVLVALELRL